MSEQTFQIAVKALIRNEKGEILLFHVPEWNHNPDHWDLPGGRMDPDETFLDTLKRELQEELGVSYTGTPKQLMGMLTNITIDIGNVLMPLVFMIYQVEITDQSKMELTQDTREDEMQWFTPKKAAELMSFKFTPEFCELIGKLKS